MSVCVSCLHCHCRNIVIKDMAKLLCNRQQGMNIVTFVKCIVVKTALCIGLIVFSSNLLVESCRIVGRLVSKVTLFKPTSSISSYGTILLFSLVI